METVFKPLKLPDTTFSKTQLNHDQHGASSTLPVDRSRSVRLRIGRRLLPLLIAAMGLCTLVVLHRNDTHIKKACDRLEPYLVPIQRHLDLHNTLPLVYPTYQDLDPAPTPDEFSYVDAQIIQWARIADRRALIGYGKNDGLIFRSNGRAVVLCENGQLKVEWMPHNVFGPILKQQETLARAAQASPR